VPVCSFMEMLFQYQAGPRSSYRETSCERNGAQAPNCGGKTYYWLIFSSTRAGLPFNSANFKAGLLYPSEPTSQLYLTAVVDDGTGHLTTYPGVYVWNQPTASAISPGSNQSNHTPLWDVVSIPAPPPPR